MRFKREEIIKLMEDVYTAKEAAEYLNISTQRLNQLVHENRITPIKTTKSVTLFLKEDLDNRGVSNFSNKSNLDNGMFDIDTTLVRDAILYYTVQQYFNNNDKRTTKFIEELISSYGFDYRAGLQKNIPFLASHLKTTDKDFYSKYTFVKGSFQKLTDEVILIKKGESNYPKLLAKTDEAPPYLFAKGDLNLLDQKSVCVVGSRNASSNSMKNTERLVKSLIKRNIVVNAGLAKGIDTATHTAALENGGKTIAVIGTPINQYYPKENRLLQQRIEKEGLVLSQFPPCNTIQRWNFPTRNGVMSGLALATVIMEAGETSGALKQADYALKQNRDVLIPQAAVENSMISWPKKYLERGAKKFTSLKEILMILNLNTILKDAFSNLEEGELIDVEVD